MIVWRDGTVVGAAELRSGVQQVDVMEADGTLRQAVHYTDVRPPLVCGDRVVVNVTAAALGLDGGLCLIHDVAERREPDEASASEGAEAEQENTAGLGASPKQRYPGDDEERESFAQEQGQLQSGHIMKLRYMPQQRAVLAVEEEASPHRRLFAEPRQLDGMPVLIGELHSMLPVAVAWIRGSGEGVSLRLSYIMTDGGALPLVLSGHTARLRASGWLDGTVTYGHAYGGDLEAVNKYTALLAARHVQGADIAIVTMGPGIVGTGTPFGHTATELAELVHAVRALGGKPVVMARVSFAEARERHRGVSHHVRETLGKLALARAAIPLPDELEEPHKRLIRRQLEESGCADRHDPLWVPGVGLAEAERRLAAYDAPITTMGRQLRDDPAFFLTVCAAAQAALSAAGGRR
ncbi:DUF3866 family protein [Paenibacillus hodogayensis]|uniref:DUF3866 family protein n=1 Tax=Paenibacillus hodogayensis TaxID=279208 RepID=A0ABV5W5F0_9BACL